MRGCKIIYTVHIISRFPLTLFRMTFALVYLAAHKIHMSESTTKILWQYGLHTITKRGDLDIKVKPTHKAILNHLIDSFQSPLKV